jgi:hypothetical protein
MNLHHSKLPQKMGLININKKKMKDSHLPQPLLDFLTPTEDFFYPPFFIFYLKSLILIQNLTLKPLFPR